MAVLNNALGGAGTGATVGAAVGSIFPGPGTAIGSAIGALTGLIAGSFSGGQAKKKTEEALSRVEAIPEVDPMQLGFLDELRRERRAVETGFTPEYTVARDIIQQASASGIDAAMDISGGSPALALSAIRRLQSGTGTNINKLLGTIGTQKTAYTSAMADLIDKIAQRKLDVETYKTAQQLAVATQEQADLNQSANLGIVLGANTMQDIDFSKIWDSLTKEPALLTNNSDSLPLDLSYLPSDKELTNLGSNIFGDNMWNIPGIFTKL